MCCAGRCLFARHSRCLYRASLYLPTPRASIGSGPLQYFQMSSFCCTCTYALFQGLCWLLPTATPPDVLPMLHIWICSNHHNEICGVNNHTQPLTTQSPTCTTGFVAGFGTWWHPEDHVSIHTRWW